MTTKKPPVGKKYYSVVEANSTLPLVRAIVRDITELARDLRDRQERLNRLKPKDQGGVSDVYLEELHHLQAGFERDQERMLEYESELQNLGIELKDYYAGLIDFPCWMEGREVYLCWRLGEPEVAYWHELEAGFAGRQKILVNQAKN